MKIFFIILFSLSTSALFAKELPCLLAAKLAASSLEQIGSESWQMINGVPDQLFIDSSGYQTKILSTKSIVNPKGQETVYQFTKTNDRGITFSSIDVKVESYPGNNSKDHPNFCHIKSVTNNQ